MHTKTPGVTWNKRQKRWRAQIANSGGRGMVHLGFFADEEDAIAARLDAEANPPEIVPAYKKLTEPPASRHPLFFRLWTRPNTWADAYRKEVVIP